MRNVIVILLIAFLLFGCASKEAVDETKVIPVSNISSNITQETNASNITETPENITNLTAVYNLTTELVNTTNISENKTQTEKEVNGIQFGKYILILEDVTVVGSNDCAVVQFFDISTMESLKKDIICKGKDYYWTAPDKHKYRFLITEIAAGYLNNAVWAKVYIYG